MRQIRIIALGEQILAGVGDPRAMGWLGRVLAKTDPSGTLIEAYPLAVPEETTEELSARWETEVRRRVGAEVENHLIIALGDHDLDIDITTARSRLQLANVLDAAHQSQLPVLVVGPIPGLDAERNARLADLNRAYADVVTRRGFHYVDTFTALQQHEQWRADLNANHGLPGQAGYGLIAWLVLHRGWYQWLNLPEPTA
ncbi:GDSL-type esterase/lipase family protein [Micrococcoides hystricis]|uniref:GDSL-type esterase/lipase family protein n=1 Tax=Micrococcoides hystricis TaxID=1572761 RepID=A0ABV6PBQ1_9MICC